MISKTTIMSTMIYFPLFKFHCLASQTHPVDGGPKQSTIPLSFQVQVAIPLQIPFQIAISFPIQTRFQGEIQESLQKPFQEQVMD